MTGKGRLIHVDGHIHYGDWLENKAHGYGTFLHADGTYYKGEWEQDK